MAALPIAGLLAQSEVLAFQLIDSVAPRGHVVAQILQQGHRLRGGTLGATDVSQLAVHSQLPLPEMSRIEKKWHSDHYQKERLIGLRRNWTDCPLNKRVRRSFTIELSVRAAPIAALSRVT